VGLKLLTIIVNYRTAPYVLDSLKALVPQLEALGQAEAWIVDNKSPDDSLQLLEAGLREAGYGERVRLMASDRNGGFGAGNNVALKKALESGDPPEYFYLLNPDAVPDTGAIQALVSHMDLHPHVGIAGSYLHDPDGTPHCSSFRFPSLWSEIEGGFRFRPVSKLLHGRTVYMDVPEQTCEVDWVTGASIILRRGTLEKIGLFDEGFFLYFEETDLCRRAREAGITVSFVRESSVSHAGSVSTGVSRERRTPPYWFASRRRYFEKAYGPAYHWAASAAWTLGFASFRMREKLRRKPIEDPYMLRDFWKHTLKPKRP
jgi:GT2 family glycosyltransferase